VITAADPTSQAVVQGLVDKLTASLPKFADPNALGNPDAAAFYGAAPSSSANLQQGLTYLQGRLSHLAGPGLATVECGLSKASLPGVCTQDGLLEGINQVDGGVTALVNGVVGAVQKGVGDGDDTKTDGTLRGGVHSLQAGADQLGAGGDALASGLGQLGTGAHQLSTGAGQLSDGLKDAAAGSTQLADGLGAAATGAPKLVDGTQQLSDEGTSQVVASGKETAADFGVKYAVLTAGAERAADESMAYGAPEGAAGATAYSIDIAGADGSGVHALGRLIAAIALFAAGIGIAALVGRRIA
jgi:putative membrane protein